MVSSSSDSVSTSPMSSAADATHPRLPQEDQEVSSVTVPEDYKESVVRDSLDHMEKEQIEKFKRYEIEGRQYLMSKYFSDKTIFGGNIFDVKTTKDGESSKVSRVPGYQSYADPANFNDDRSSASNFTSETPLHSATKKRSSKK